MLKEHSTFVKQVIAAIDCILLLAAFFLANKIVFGPAAELQTMIDYWIMFIGFMSFYLYFAWTRSLFSILHFNWMSGLFRRVVMIFISAGFLGAAILYLIPRGQSSRKLYLAFALLSFVFIGLEKFFIKQFITRMRKNNRNITTLILFGRGRVAAQINQEISCHPEWGFRVIRKLDLSISPTEFETVLKNCYVEEVCFCIPRKLTKDGFAIDPYLQICEEMGRPARVFLNISQATYFARWEYHRFMDRPTLILHTVELDPDQMIFKRMCDMAGALVGIVVLVACYPFLAVAIKCTSRGPVFFKQVRVGKNGKRFVIYKFRSMADDAERKKKELLRHNELDGAVFKMRNDPRVTTIGRFMRRCSLDELPQFINVFKGEMSLVGTRPPTPDEVSNYQKWHHRRMSIRPGLTGLWQVSGRNLVKTFDDIVKLDLKYIDNWSIWLDIKIIVKTIRVLFKRDTAF
ncbi:MAG: sugar transferase [Chitinispirillaceae bacterium]|nr:sugar transferase [Chitinispirillaceae bacterium]